MGHCTLNKGKDDEDKEQCQETNKAGKAKLLHQAAEAGRCENAGHS
jgi:hypothetical protein